jgi:tetratricopeptide (TPR) repeat protein
MNQAASLRNLYTLVEPLGAGGMGIVYRAIDRLRSQTVAIKRVVIPPELVELTASNNFGDEYYLGLAKEFELLATLRHPNIISVYDYGFDQNRQPFLVMELIEDAEEITAPSINLTLKQKVDILIQMFEALDYLHRRGVIHSDLKPSNVLMSRTSGQEYRVRVLDFGLSLREGESDPIEAGGTLNYMAPEVLQGGKVSIAADLYAGGVIAYELLAGEHPFDRDSLGEMIDAIMNRPVDIDSLDLPDTLKIVLYRLMARDPDDRYHSAWEVLSALTSVIDRKWVESVAVRESFIQAASFVGREAELKQLRDSLKQAALGEGVAWLVGGESGVGKSRLLEEVRIWALVQGMQVIRGQAVAEDSSQYSMWRDVLRRLILTSAITDLEAAIVKPFVTDIADILGRPIEDAAELPSTEGLRRLALTIGDILRRVPEPLMIILEDLHWANQSQELIRQICTQLGELNVMLVGTYRDDEAPDLPHRLEGLNTMKLSRLAPEAVMTLSEKMIGSAAHLPGVKELIAKETEGNVFFIVEVVRALAEESGRLQDIGRITLPERVFPGGIRAVIRRRLDRVPAPGQTLLSIAAISGRQLDESLLQCLLKQHPEYLPGMELERWLVLCSDAAVLNIIDGQWRFSHDKLREALIADINPDLYPVFNRHIAEAIELSAGDLKPYANRLVLHWQAAGDVAKELHYSILAGDAAYLVSAYTESVTYFKRALDILGAAPQLSQGEVKSKVTVNLAKVYVRLSLYEDARRLLNDDIIATTIDTTIIGEMLSELGRIALYQGDYVEAERHLQASLERYRAYPNHVGNARALIGLGYASSLQGKYEQAEIYFRDSLKMLTMTEDSFAKAHAFNGLGNLLTGRGNFAQAIEALEESLKLYRAIGNREGIAGALLDLGKVAMFDNKTERAAEYFTQSLGGFHEIENRWGMAACLNNLGFIALNQRNFREAQRYFEESLYILRAIGDRVSVANTINNLGHVAVGRGEYATALEHYRQALRDATELGADPVTLESLVGIATIYAKQGKIERLLELVTVALSHPATNPEIKGMAEPLLEQIRSWQSDSEIEAAMERATSVNLAVLAAKHIEL